MMRCSVGTYEGFPSAAWLPVVVSWDGLCVGCCWVLADGCGESGKR